MDWSADGINHHSTDKYCLRISTPSRLKPTSRPAQSYLQYNHITHCLPRYARQTDSFHNSFKTLSRQISIASQSSIIDEYFINNFMIEETEILATICGKVFIILNKHYYFALRSCFAAKTYKCSVRVVLSSILQQDTTSTMFKLPKLI